jgi:hypothetical protein
MGAVAEDAGIETENRAARAKPEPNVFIAGSAKAGSTSLVYYLRQHPDVFMPAGDFSRKEPAHFCSPAPPWQERYQDFNTYLGLFAEAGDRKAIGEASVAYLKNPGADERIYTRYPAAKIIIILRNPADRAFSWFTFMCQYGIEGSSSFEGALAEEQARAEDLEFKSKNWTWYWMTQYFAFGLCGEYVERFARRFPPEQVHFLLFDDLKADPLGETQKVYRFLGVDPTFVPTIEVHNPTWVPFSVRLQHFLALRTKATPGTSHPEPSTLGFLDRRVYPFIGGLNLLLGRLRRVRLNPETRRHLLVRYREDILRTGQAIKRDLSHWLADAR